MAQQVKNLPAVWVWETWARSLGWDDPMEKRMATHSQYPGLENSVDCVVHGVAKRQTRLSDSPFHLKDREQLAGEPIF